MKHVFRKGDTKFQFENENSSDYDKRVVVETVMKTASNYVLSKAQTKEKINHPIV